MEHILIHLVGRYLINLSAIACIVAGVFSVGISALFLPIDISSDCLAAAIIPAGGAWAAIAEVFRIKARLFVKLPFAWAGGVILIWFTYSFWSFNGVAISALIIFLFSGFIFGLSHLMDSLELDRSEDTFQRLTKCSVNKDDLEIWNDVARAWVSPRMDHRAIDATRHNVELLQWILKSLSSFLKIPETKTLTELLQRLSLEKSSSNHGRVNRACGDVFLAFVDAHIQGAFGQRLHRTFQMTTPR